MFAKTLQNTGLTPPEVCKFANFYGGRGPKTEVEEHPSVSRETSFLTPEIRTFFSEDCLSKTWTLRSTADPPGADRDFCCNINGRHTRIECACPLVGGSLCGYWLSISAITNTTITVAITPSLRLVRNERCSHAPLGRRGEISSGVTLLPIVASADAKCH